MTLRAKDGYVYYNGYAYGKEVHLSPNDSINNWNEITIEEAVLLEDQHNKENNFNTSKNIDAEEEILLNG